MDSLLRNNNLVRVIAFILAVILWLVVRAGSEGPGQTTIIDRVTESISGTADVLVDSNRVSLVGNPPEVTVNIQGERLAVWQAKMQVNKIKFVVDARGMGEGVHEVPLRIEGLPSDVTAEAKTVSIRLEPNLTRTFPVQLVIDGVDPAVLRDIRTNPLDITVFGPASLLDQVQKIQARVPNKILDAPGSEQTVIVYAVNAQGKPVNLTLQPKTVDLVYQPAVQRKTFSNLQPTVKGLANGEQIVLPTGGLSVTLEGYGVSLIKVNPADIRITIDVTGLAPGKYEREATVEVPPTVKLADPQPFRVPITITASPKTQ
ncbi:CdaR family protein [Effusibacillus dendaii]|uniref:YbbR-like domain-containing protein YbbR n=1 Tax=Effusibacillus dendaii TaxID=2743772 RepID=A0A7I8DAS1_9BACL|nr:CdaR family protein [Effusibacillus dendaii]BCJ87288.1 hypothetical protein skT53_22730 [Effusibacillus dendaii]